MTKELTSLQQLFIKKVTDRVELVRKARSERKTINFKNIPNTAKVSITQTGIYTDSYLPTIPSSLDRLCRMRASVVVPLMLARPPGKDQGRHVIKVQGHQVKLTSAGCRDLIHIMLYTKTATMKCACCNLEAKYAYVEKHIAPREAKSRSVIYQQYNMHFYGVRSNGVEIRMTVDHVKPTAHGGQNVVSNKQILCSDCNGRKAALPNEAFMLSREKLNELLKTVAPNA